MSAADRVTESAKDFLPNSPQSTKFEHRVGEEPDAPPVCVPGGHVIYQSPPRPSTVSVKPASSPHCWSRSKERSEELLRSIGV